MTVFLDTVGLLAIWNKSDQWHRAAERCFAEILATQADLISTAYVLAECGNAAARRSYRSSVVRLRQQLQQVNSIVIPNEEDWQTAWQAYERGEADSAGLVDQISFVVMRRLGLNKAFTNDKHFRAAGFETLF